MSTTQLLARARLVIAAFGIGGVVSVAGCADRTDTAGDTSSAAGNVAEGARASEPGQAAASSDAATLADYDLEMGQVDKYFAAYRNIGSALQSMSAEERAQIEFDASDTDLNGYIARLEAQPVLNRAIQQAGLTAREFSLILWSMLQSGMAVAVMETQPNVNEDSLAREMQVNMDNVRFMREHQAEIQQKQQALDQELRSMGIAAEDS